MTDETAFCVELYMYLVTAVTCVVCQLEATALGGI